MKMIIGLTLMVLLPALPSVGEDAVAEVGHKPTLKKTKKIKASFAKLKPMVGIVGEDAKFTVYEGLPMYGGSFEGFDPALDPKTIVRRFGFLFHQTPLEIEAEDRKELKALVKDPKSFVKFGGFKLCGGFHPDFSIVFGSGDNAVEMHLCFGCHELKAYRKGVEVYCDIPDGTYEELKKLLQKYQKPLPQPAE